MQSSSDDSFFVFASVLARRFRNFPFGGVFWGCSFRSICFLNIQCSKQQIPRSPSFQHLHPPSAFSQASAMHLSAHAGLALEVNKFGHRKWSSSTRGKLSYKHVQKKRLIWAVSFVCSLPYTLANMPTQRPPHACADWGGCPMPAGFLTAGAYTRLPLSLRNKDLHYLGKLWNIRSTAYAAIYIYIIWNITLVIQKWNYSFGVDELNETIWHTVKKSWSCANKPPKSPQKHSNGVQCPVVLRSCVDTGQLFVMVLLTEKIPKKLKMVDELRVFWPGNVWNLHDLWQALLTNHGYAQTISCPGHVGRTSPWRASCPRQSWNLRRKPHSVRITLVASRSMFRGIVHIPVDNWPLLKRESSWYLFRNLPCEPPKLHDKNEYSILQCLDRWACRIEGIMEM